MKNRKMKKSKLDGRKMVLAGVVISILVISMMILMGNGTTLSHAETTLKTIHVATGETLWEIASVEAKNNEYYANQDIRYIVKDIKKVNQLENCNLYAGQELLIPSI